MKNNKHGFTLVELLVVLLIIAILAAVATPLYLQNAQRARASEAVASMSLIRQALRERFINTNSYGENIDSGDIDEPLANDGLNIDLEVTQYFSNDAFEVIITNPVFLADAEVVGSPASPVNFVIRVDGKDTIDCKDTDDDEDCAVKGDQVKGGDDNSQAYMLEMDNSGRIFVSYENGAANSWEAY